MFVGFSEIERDLYSNNVIVSIRTTVFKILFGI